MAINLVSSVMQFLTPEMITRIANALNTDRADAQTGIRAAVPALLAAFTGIAAQPSGAQNLVETIKQQSGVFDNFGGMLAGGNQSSLIETGSSMLTSLLGRSDQSALTGAIGQFAGLGTNTSNSLVAMLAPLVMGAIGKQIGMANLNPSNLTSLLTSQKDQIAQALPQGMGRLLGGTRLLDSIGGAAGSTARATTAAGDRLTRSAAVASAASRSATPNWVYWVVPLALVVGAIWYLLRDRTDQLAQVAPTPPTQAQSVVVGGVDLGKQIGDSLGQVRTSLASVTDVRSAQAALPSLQAATDSIDKVDNMVGQLPADQRQIVAGMVASATTTIDQMISKVLEIPGVGEVLKPTTDNLRTALADISGQPSTVGSGR